MKNIIKLERTLLKNNATIKEDDIQRYIFENPSVLGIGDLTPIQREKVQPSGGRLDLLLVDDDNTRYEVEIQLGATDPSHIIRTIEYWDAERKRYPQYDHCAVIVAEEITGRFMNVISLFNGAIPLIALQLSAYQVGDDISLTFTKVLDRLTYATDEEDEFEATDRDYWEKRSTPKMMKAVDEIFKGIKEYAPEFEMKYNKYYIGVTKDGSVKNFLNFRPRKSFLYLHLKGEFDADRKQELEDLGLDVSYVNRDKQLRIRLESADQYKQNKETLDAYIQDAMRYFNLLDY